MHEASNRLLGFVFLASAPAALAQVVGRKARIGFFTEAPLDQVWQRAAVEPFRQGLRELGYIEGQNIVLEIRSAEGKNERLKPLMSELLQLNLDVLVAAFPGAALAAKEATRTLPVVAAAVDNPILMGLAATLARPGGNVRASAALPESSSRSACSSSGSSFRACAGSASCSIPTRCSA